MQQDGAEPNKFWDKQAVSYSFFDDSYFPSRLKFDLLKKYAQKTHRCLDVGIANGIFSLPLSPFVSSIDGIDISENMLTICQNEVRRCGLNNINLHQQSAEKLEFEENTFDIVFSFATLALVQNIGQSLSEISRVLKPGGCAILDVIGKKNLSRVHWEKYYRSIGHFGLSYFELPEIVQILKDLQMETVEKHAIGLLDQWKYIPGLNKMKFIESITHGHNAVPDLDYRCSQKLPEFANHWLIVCRKK